VIAPRPSTSWRMRSVSYWFALQPNVWYQTRGLSLRGLSLNRRLARSLG
jgi:hypothetical protein